MKICKILLFMFLFLSFYVIGASYYVSTSGDDANPGTKDKPWRTIQKAANTVGPGDTVIVMSGTYDERVILPRGKSGTQEAKITFKAEPRRTVNMKGFQGDRNNYIRIEGFNITYNKGGWLGNGIWLDGNNWEIVDNYFYDIPGAGIMPTWGPGQIPNNVYLGYNKIYRCASGFVVSGKNWLVEYNEVERLIWVGGDSDYSRFFGENHIIRNNYFHGALKEEIGTSHVDGFQTFENNNNIAKNILIEGNIVDGFYHQGIMASGDKGSHENIIVRNNIFMNSASWGICAGGITNLKVYNNVFANIYYHGIGFRWNGTSTPTTGEVKNNIFYNAGSNYWAESGCTMEASNNLLYKTTGSINPTNYPNDIVNKDPKFVDVENKNFKLQPDSPAIDAGIDISEEIKSVIEKIVKNIPGVDIDSLIKKDIEGTVRPQGSSWDIGPYEYTKIFYIRAGASGKNDGSDWINAFTSFSAANLDNSNSLEPRGNIYYVAEGDYGRVRIKNPISGSEYITIKKATLNDHGTDVGWDPSFARQATFAPGTFINTSYVIWDGSVGSGENFNEYGFKITSEGPVDTRLFGIAYVGYSNLVITHVEVAHTAFVCWGSEGDSLQVGLYSNPAKASYITIRHNYFSGGTANILIRKWENSTIESNYFNGNWSSPNHHGEQISSGDNCNDIILRNNIFKESKVYVVGAHKANNARWKIYNNIVIGGAVTAIWGNADSSTSDVMINWEIHNNTHVNIKCSGWGAIFVGRLTNPQEQRSLAYNNLFYNCVYPRIVTGEGAIDHQYNAFYDCTGYITEENSIEISSGDPFVDSVNFNYHLKLPTKNGILLSPPFNVDFDGITRGIDGNWDKGAFEYVKVGPSKI